MLEEIGSVDRIDEYVAKAKDKSDPFRLMGFGHRVYKNFDPRATVMRQTCHEVLAELNIQDPLLDIAMKLEQIALEDPYFVEKKLYPNVDFYSGIILKAIGIPTSMFTVIFAMSRTVGWIFTGMRCFLNLVTRSAALVSYTLVKLHAITYQQTSVNTNKAFKKGRMRPFLLP